MRVHEFLKKQVHEIRKSSLFLYRLTGSSDVIFTEQEWEFLSIICEKLKDFESMLAENDEAPVFHRFCFPALHQ